MIYLYEPFLNGNEKKYVNECLDTNWISSKGKFVSLFEDAFAQYTSTKHAVSVSNGTVAIHLALTALGIKAGDEVLVPSFTYIASVNPIMQLGATPVFVDSDIETYQMDLTNMQSKLSSKTRAVMAVHLYGGVCDMEKLQSFCKNHNLFLIEDCAEALGSKWNNQHVGTFGHVGCFSFFGNKTVTTGEGGMVISNDSALAEKMAHLKGQGVSTTKFYWHDMVAFNYRMTNIQAAIGLAQMENIYDILKLKRNIAQVYYDEFKKRNLPLTMLWEQNKCYNSFWLPTISLKDATRRDELMVILKEQYGVETRPTFYPVHTMPMYCHLSNNRLSNAEKLSAAGMNIPGYPALTQEQQLTVVDALEAALT